jgi:hypothetical protein
VRPGALGELIRGGGHILSIHKFFLSNSKIY